MTEALFQYLALGASQDDGDGQPTIRRPQPTRVPETRGSADPRLSQLQSADEHTAQIAFETLFRETYAQLVRFAVQYASTVDAAEDVVGEVFASLWDHRATLVAHGSIEGYLFGAVRHRAVSVYRQSLRHTGRHVPILGDGEYWGVGNPPESPDAGVDADDVRETIWRAIATLPARQREILTLRWQAELDWDDIARIVGSTSAAVQMQHSRAARTLRSKLAGYLK